MSTLESNRLFPLVIILSVGLLGSLYLYFDAVSMVDTPLNDQDLVDDLMQSLDGVSAELDEAKDEIDQLEATNAKLGETVEELKAAPPIMVVEKSEILLDVSGEGEVKNVVLLIGDGMGIGQLTAAEVMNGEDDLVLTSLPYKSLVATHSSSQYVTDSAASATALATGFKTENGKVSISSDDKLLLTALEEAEDSGKATGIVTTTRITHATPACFFAHVTSRNMEGIIAGQLLESGVDIVLGGGSTYFSGLKPEDHGYTVVYDSTELDSIESGKVLGLFNSGYMSYELDRSENEPSLSEMTSKSLELLSTDSDGFFLMVEGGRIDHASHDNNFDYTIAETLEFDQTVNVALEFALGRNDTLVLVTADHETGGLSVIGGYFSGSLQVDWVTDDHVGGMIPVYGFGPMASEVIAFKDNTDIGAFLLSVIE